MSATRGTGGIALQRVFFSEQFFFLNSCDLLVLVIEAGGFSHVGTIDFTEEDLAVFVTLECRSAKHEDNCRDDHAVRTSSISRQRNM